MYDVLPYRTIVAVDFEFEFGGHSSFEDASRSGERPRPVCMVARDLVSGQTWRLWRGEFGPAPPFPIGPDTLFVAYYVRARLLPRSGLADAGQHSRPLHRISRSYKRIADARRRRPGRRADLLRARQHRQPGEKDELRALVLRGGPWSEQERAAALDYCATDTAALERLLPAMLPHIDLPRALLRGRYMAAAATMEFNGVPMDVATLSLLRQHWTDIQNDLIRTIDADYGVFDGRSFRALRWAEYLIAQNIPWPRLETDRLDLSDDAFREMARIYPKIAPMRELRGALSELRLNDLSVGKDGRNRTILSAFRSRTGRNQPSNTRFIFGPSVWLRSLIQPAPGCGVAYIDWQQQEFGIAAALAGDAAMLAAYQSGDPYLTFAKQAGAVPQDATKDTHKVERELFKTCALGVQYGMEAPSLALRIAQPPIVARDLLRAHRETYRTFWRWSDAAVDHAMLRGSLHTVFGWHIRTGETVNPRSLRNFPMQSNGAEMLRLACCLATESGIEVCAPVHDAVLICAPLDRLEHDVARMRACMAAAARAVLAGFELRTDAVLIRHPERYQDPRGAVMWERVTRLIAKQQAERAAA
jgi:DNA polymerase-1